MTLEAVTTFQVSQEIVVDTENALKVAGANGYELFALWSGVIEGRRFAVRNLHVPKQTSYQTEDGLLVRVDGPALHQLNVWLFENSQMLGVQIHAHPSDAYHSHTDDTYPIVTTVGGLSIVAADFAVDGLLTARTAAYRLSKKGWRPMQNPTSSQLIALVA